MWWRKKREHDLESELRSHLELEAEEQPDRYAAQRALGNLALIKEDTRAMWGWTFVERLGQDAGYAARVLRRSPGFTAVAVLSLALGIGANTAIFGLIDAVLLKTLPVAHPEQLVILDCLSKNGMRGSFSHTDYEWIRDRNLVFSGVAASAEMRVDWNAGGSKQGPAKQPVLAGLVSGNYFSTLGVNPALGRMFSADDDSSGGGQVVVLSYGFWQRALGRNPSIQGQTLILEDLPYRIAGVAPAEFFGTAVGSAPDVWVPLSNQPRLSHSRSYLNTRNVGWLELIARLKPGVTRQQASTSVAALYAAVQSELRIDPRMDSLNRIGINPGGGGLSYLRTQYSPALRILMGVVVLVLLIACANVSNLLLARAAARRREFAVRLAIGAARSGVIRQLLTESLLLASLGGAAGFAVTPALTSVLISASGARGLQAPLNTRVLIFNAVISVLTAVLFGLMPAFRGSRVDAGNTIKAHTRLEGGRRGGLRFARILVAAQVAISLMVLIAAGLSIRSLLNLEKSDAGFDQNAIVQIGLNWDPGYNGRQIRDVAARVIDGVRVVPGVESASASTYGFGSGMTRICCVSVQGRALSSDLDRVTRAQPVSPDYFRTMAIPLLYGRAFTDADTEKRPTVAIVNETMARRFFGDSNPVGKRFGWSTDGSGAIEVIGVVKDARYDNLRETIPPMVYQSIWQVASGVSFVEVRVAGGNNAIAGRLADIRTAIQETDANIRILEASAMSAVVDRSLGQERLLARFVSAFGLLALLLAAVGLYGVLSYTVTRRTSEIGIRIALGAQPRSVKWMILADTLGVLSLGVPAGILGAAAAGKLIASQLFGLAPSDPSAFLSAGALMLVIAGVAAYVPARRAARVDPMTALRSE